MEKNRALVAPMLVVVVAQAHTQDHIKRLEEIILALVEAGLSSKNAVDDN